MASCLKRIFKRGSSIMLVCRKNFKTNFINKKTFRFATSFSNENFKVDFSPSLISCICNLNANLPMSFSLKSGIDDVRIPKLYAEEKNYLLNNLSDSNYNRVQKVFYCAKECKAYKEDSQKIIGELGKAEPEQVLHVFDVLSRDLPQMFKSSLNYEIYHKNILFENNIKGTSTIGLSNYIKQIALIRTLGHLKFAVISVEILKITAHPEDGTVRVRWRIKGISTFKIFAAIIRYMSLSKPIVQEGWYDGFSIYYVKSDGLVHKHVVDKMMPDDKEKVCNFQNDLAAKIAFALGVTVKDFSTQVLMENFYVSRNYIHSELNNFPKYSNSLLLSVKL